MQHTATPGAPSWADDQDPILTDGHGPLAAFDQPPVPRAHRIPHTAPPKPSLSRRLHNALRRLSLTRKLRQLGLQLDDIERRLKVDANDAHALSKLFRSSAFLEGRRRALRRELLNVAQEYRAVRKQIDDLEPAL